MFVVKRDGKEEPVSFDKITKRISQLCEGLSESVEPVMISQKVSSIFIIYILILRFYLISKYILIIIFFRDLKIQIFILYYIL